MWPGSAAGQKQQQWHCPKCLIRACTTRRSSYWRWTGGGAHDLQTQSAAKAYQPARVGKCMETNAVHKIFALSFLLRPAQFDDDGSSGQCDVANFLCNRTIRSPECFKKRTRRPVPSWGSAHSIRCPGKQRHKLLLLRRLKLLWELHLLLASAAGECSLDQQHWTLLSHCVRHHYERTKLSHCTTDHPQWDAPKPAGECESGVCVL